MTLTLAHEDDVPAIVEMRNDVARALTREFGRGHWSRGITPDAQRALMDRSRVYVMREGAAIVAGLRLVLKRPPPEHRPWFSHVRRPVYLHDMAVLPSRQRQGVGRACMEEAKRLVREWPADAIRLDAYDAPAGAGPFYRKCGLEECGRRLYFRAPIIYYEWVG